MLYGPLHFLVTAFYFQSFPHIPLEFDLRLMVFFSSSLTIHVDKLLHPDIFNDNFLHLLHSRTCRHTNYSLPSQSLIFLVYSYVNIILPFFGFTSSFTLPFLSSYDILSPFTGHIASSRISVIILIKTIDFFFFFFFLFIFYIYGSE